MDKIKKYKNLINQEISYLSKNIEDVSIELSKEKNISKDKNIYSLIKQIKISISKIEDSVFDIEREQRRNSFIEKNTTKKLDKRQY